MYVISEAQSEPTAQKYNSSIRPVVQKSGDIFSDFFFFNNTSLRVYWICVPQQPSHLAPRLWPHKQVPVPDEKGMVQVTRWQNGSPHLGTEFRFCAVTLLAVSMSHTQQCCWGVRRKSKPGSWFKIILDLNLPEENKWWATSPRSAQNVQPKEPCESEGGWEALRSPTQLSTTRCRLWAVHCHSLSPLEPLFLPHLYWDIIDMQHMQV